MTKAAGLLFVLAGVLMLLSGCAQPRVVTYAEARAIDECSLEAAKTGGYDWIDAAMRRGEVKARCLRLKGFAP